MTENKFKEDDLVRFKGDNVVYKVHNWYRGSAFSNVEPIYDLEDVNTSLLEPSSVPERLLERVVDIKAGDVYVDSDGTTREVKEVEEINYASGIRIHYYKYANGVVSEHTNLVHNFTLVAGDRVYRREV